jgi:hypothetical protein
MDLFPVEDDLKALTLVVGPSETGHFPLIRKLSAHRCALGELWISCVDVYRELENSAGVNYVVQKCKKYEYVCFRFLNVEWNQRDQTWVSVEPGLREMPVLHLKDLEKFVLASTAHARKTKQQKVDLLKKFQIVVTAETRKGIPVPIECSVLDTFIKACPFRVECQYRVGKYRLDAFICRLNLAIQIDENGHKNYNVEEERECDTAMRDHNIVCVRFVPDEDDPVGSGLRLVNIIWQRTLSPDFSTFTNKFKLL